MKLKGGEDESASEGDEQEKEFRDVMFQSITKNDVMQMKFRDPEAAYAVYNEFGRSHGFNVRKGKNVKNSKGETVR